ncbi:hypothetical protein SLS62_002486 [Diatrype stigma]|uniref:Transmembrane protein n=1 Tax=Diatrype stigma TaxID=117547 RepID=A0AAN9YUY7_9PEZI
MSQGEMSQPRGEELEDPNKPNVDLTGRTEQSRGVDVGATTASNGQSTPHTQAMQQPLPQPYPHHQQLPYAPYHPQAPPQPYPSYAQPARVLPPYNQTWTISKLVLTGLSLCWAVVLLALALSISIKRSYGPGVGLALYAAPVQIIVIVWNIAELITFLVRSLKRKGTAGAEASRRGIHPGAHIAMHLLFWLACVFGIFMSLLMLSSAESHMEYCAENDEDDDTSVSISSYRGSSSVSSSSSSSYCDEYADAYAAYTPGLRAVLAMWCLAIITHFVLFVLACIDTHQRNRLRPAGVVFAAPGGAPYVAQPLPPPQGMFPVPYYPQQQQQAYMNPASAAPHDGKQQPYQIPQHNYQNLTGFYAPPPVSAQAPARTPAQAAPQQPGPSVPDGGDEITSAPART